MRRYPRPRAGLPAGHPPEGWRRRVNGHL